MTISRRGFLGALAGASAVTALGPAIQAVELVSGRFVLEGRAIVLDRPLVLTGLKDFVIHDCRFYASDKFPKGKAMIDATDCTGEIYGCFFENPTGDAMRLSFAQPAS